MRIDHLAFVVAAALTCAACAATPAILETGSAPGKAVKRPAGEKSGIAKVATKPAGGAAQNVKFNDSGKAAYCSRWWEHRAAGTLPSHVRVGTSDVAHNDAYCGDHK